MGKKIILTEQQLLDLVEGVHLTEAKMSCTVATYEGLSKFLGDKEVKKLGHNTTVERLGEFEVGIRYHRTFIIKIDVTDFITVNTGGWETSTTKERLNQFLGCRNVYIQQKKGVWTIHGPNDSLPYVDGMQILPTGQITAPVKR
jgi:hypothetical protein